MFQQLGAPILGMVENMAGDIFGRGGTERMAGDLGLPFLGRLELYAALRENSDSGRPHANYEGDATLKASLEGIVSGLVEAVDRRNLQPTPTLEVI
jgi:ATP-binding protein involved in chromosome partitioning